MEKKKQIEPVTDGVEIAPGHHVSGGVPDLPRVALVDWIRRPDGAFQPRVRKIGRRVRLSEKNLKELALGVEYRTMLRLIKAGFVDGEKIAPGCWTFDLESFFLHREACADDPDFWEDGSDNRKEYRESYCL